MPRVTITGPDGQPEEVHLLREEPFDRERFDMEQVLSELRQTAKADNPSIGLPVSIYFFMSMCAGGLLLRTQMADEWKMAIILATSGLAGLVFQLSIERGNGSVPDHLIADLARARRVSRQSADQKSALLAAHEESRLLQQIYQAMRKR